MPKLSRSERERIILEHVKGNPTPGWEVIERSNGKYQVKEKPIEIEEEEEEEPDAEESDDTGAINTVAKDEPMPTRSPKQNARELLRQLSELLEAEEEPEPETKIRTDLTYQQPTHPIANINWARRKLRL